MLIISYMGDHVWFITSKQTEPDLGSWRQSEDMRVVETVLQLIDVRVENPVHKPDTRALVWVLIG